MEMLRIQDREIQSNENKEIEGENEARTEGGKDEERRTEGRKEGRKEGSRAKNCQVVAHKAERK